MITIEPAIKGVACAYDQAEHAAVVELDIGQFGQFEQGGVAHQVAIIKDEHNAFVMQRFADQVFLQAALEIMRLFQTEAFAQRTSQCHR